MVSKALHSSDEPHGRSFRTLKCPDLLTGASLAKCLATAYYDSINNVTVITDTATFGYDGNGSRTSLLRPEVSRPRCPCPVRGVPSTVSADGLAESWIVLGEIGSIPSA